MELMKQTKLWDKVKNSPDYADIAHDDNLVASEVHARLTGTMGAELLCTNEPKTLVKKLVDWNKKFWQGLQQSFAKVTGRKSIARLDTEKFIKAPLADMLAGKSITKGGTR